MGAVFPITVDWLEVFSAEFAEVGGVRPSVFRSIPLRNGFKAFDFVGCPLPVISVEIVGVGGCPDFGALQMVGKGTPSITSSSKDAVITSISDPITIVSSVDAGGSCE